MIVGSEQFRNILITGASGFVGNCVVRRLLYDGYNVHVLLRPTAQIWRLAGIWKQLHTHEVDVTNKQGVRDVISSIRPDAVLRLAAYGAYEWQIDAATIVQTNVLELTIFPTPVSPPT